jgi:VWFA-related protein
MSGHDFTGSLEDIRAALVGVSGRPDAQTAQKALQSGQPEAPPVQATPRTGPMGDPILGGHAYAQQEAEEHLTQAYTADAVRRLSRMPGERILILITPGFSVRLGSSELLGLIDLANDSKVIVNTLDVRGLYVPNLAARTPDELRKNLIDQREASTGPLALAQETGGTFYRDSNDIAAGLIRLGSAPEVSYFLGFSPQNVKPDGSYHKLKVTVTRLNRFGDRRYDTQARRGYFAPMEGGDPKKESHEELQDALFSQDEIRDFPFALQTQDTKKDGGEGQLDILSCLQMKEVPFRLVAGRHVDSVTLATSIFDANGNFVTGGQKVLDLSLLEPSYQKMVQAELTVKISFDLKPGQYMVRQVVRDSENSQMAARNGTAIIPN